MSLNKVMLIGRLGQDPEVKTTQSGIQVASASIACSEKFKDKNGQKQEKTEWINLVFWNKQAELAGQYLQKGSQVYIEGQIKTDEWTDKDGNKRYSTKVHVREMQFLDPPKTGGQQQQQQRQQRPQQQQFQDNVPPMDEERLPF